MELVIDVTVYYCNILMERIILCGSYITHRFLLTSWGVRYADQYLFGKSFVILTTRDGHNDENVVGMATFPFQLVC